MTSRRSPGGVTSGGHNGTYKPLPCSGKDPSQKSYLLSPEIGSSRNSGYDIIISFPFYPTLRHNAMLSRSVAGMINNTLVLALPGSTGGAKATMDAIFPPILHVFHIIYGGKNH